MKGGLYTAKNTQAEPVRDEEQQSGEHTHYIDPVEPTRFLCGKTRNQNGYHHNNGGSVEIACVVCVDLIQVRGHKWWWSVHDAAYPDCRSHLRHPH